MYQPARPEASAFPARLARMRAGGFFRTAGVLDYLKNDSDREPLRARPDYQKLIRELEQEGAAHR